MALIAGDALDGTDLAGALQTATEAEFGEFKSKESKENTAKFNNMLATTIIEYIKQHAEVSGGQIT